MILSSVKRIEIPSGNVRKIERNGLKIWQRLPIEYQECESVISSGSEYVNTGYNPNGLTKFEIKCQTHGVTGHTGMFGCRKGAMPFLCYLENSYVGITNSIRLDLPTPTGSIGGNSLKTWQVDTPFTVMIDLQNGKVEINGERVSRYDGIGMTTEHAYPCGLFAMYEGAPFYPVVGAIYYCRIWENGEIVKDFVPCYKKQTGESGFFETVSGTFHGNLGSGALTHGADV